MSVADKVLAEFFELSVKSGEVCPMCHERKLSEALRQRKKGKLSDE